MTHEGTELRLRGEDLHWRELDGEVIALETRIARYIAANPAGTLLWRRLSAGTSRHALADVLVAAYGIDHERALADVDRFLAQLRSEGLLAA